ncbi:MAG: PQQ-binding-like beta-propeller repeat protein [Acidobacteria bacterium]|nr:PQQ-binding-like beta-propeller repeat protein [Acidobacteriota bacterium]
MRPPLISSCVVVAVLVGPAAAMMGQESPQDYPQWRGHDRDGAASAFSKPDSWPDTLRLRWKVEVGEGYATPIVIGSTVYAFTRRDGKEGITALDAETGETVWRTDYPVSYEPYEGAVDHGEGPKATPLFHHGKLYTLGISGTISSFEALGGTLVWQKPAPPVTKGPRPSDLALSRRALP